MLTVENVVVDDVADGPATLYGPVTFSEDILGMFVSITTRTPVGCSTVRGWVSEITCDLLAIELDSMPGCLFDGSEVLAVTVFP